MINMSIPDTGLPAIIEVLQSVHSALDRALGDSDVTHIENDDELHDEYPVQWAAEWLARGIEDLKQYAPKPGPAQQPSQEVQDTYLVGGPPDLKAMSGSIESDRVIQLHFRRKATDEDRKWLLDAINMKLASDAALAPGNGAVEPPKECTCHPDDNPPRPCPRKHAYSECVAATNVAPVAWRRCHVSNRQRWWLCDEKRTPHPEYIDEPLYAAPSPAALDPVTVEALTQRQREILTQAAEPTGIYPHTVGERTVLENLWKKDLVLPSCNGTQKWHATRLGRALIGQPASNEETVRRIPKAGECPDYAGMICRRYYPGDSACQQFGGQAKCLLDLREQHDAVSLQDGAK
jgi:hypothetical protein